MCDLGQGDSLQLRQPLNVLRGRGLLTKFLKSDHVGGMRVKNLLVFHYLFPFISLLFNAYSGLTSISLLKLLPLLCHKLSTFVFLQFLLVIINPTSCFPFSDLPWVNAHLNIGSYREF